MKTSRRMKVIVAMVLMTISLLTAGCITMAKSTVSLKKTKTVLLIGQKERLILEGADGKIRWRSLNKKIASVSNKGIVKAHKAGRTVIIARYKKGSYKVIVRVHPAAPKTGSLSIDGEALNQYLNPDNHVVKDNEVSISPRCVYYKNGSLYADCYIINGFDHRIFNINVKRLIISNEEGVIAEAGFGIIADGAGIDAKSRMKRTLIFSSNHCEQDARLTGKLSVQSTVNYDE